MRVKVKKRLMIRPDHREPDLIRVADIVVSPAHAEPFVLDAALPRSWARLCDRPVVDVSWSGAVSMACPGVPAVVVPDVDVEEFRSYDRRGTLPYGLRAPAHYTSFDLDHIVSMSEVRRQVHVCDMAISGLEGHVAAERRNGGVVIGGRPVTWLAIPVGRFDLAWSRAMLS